MMPEEKQVVHVGTCLEGFASVAAKYKDVRFAKDIFMLRTIILLM